MLVDTSVLAENTSAFRNADTGARFVRVALAIIVGRAGRLAGSAAASYAAGKRLGATAHGEECAKEYKSSGHRSLTLPSCDAMAK